MKFSPVTCRHPTTKNITQPRWREGWRVGPSRIAFSKSSATLLVSMAGKIIITGLAKVHTFTVNKYHVFLIGTG